MLATVRNQVLEWHFADPMTCPQLMLIYTDTAIIGHCTHLTSILDFWRADPTSADFKDFGLFPTTGPYIMLAITLVHWLHKKMRSYISFQYVISSFQDASFYFKHVTLAFAQLNKKPIPHITHQFWTLPFGVIAQNQYTGRTRQLQCTIHPI